MEKEQVAAAELELEQLQTQLLGDLPDDAMERLSKVLFPTTHTDSCTLLGKKRTLHPLTIKHARTVHALSMPVALALEAAEQSPDVVSVDNAMIAGLFDITRHLAGVYDWEDVAKAADDEDITLGEVQGLIVTQSALNGANDFLLGPLRVLLRAMEVHELIQLRFQTTFTTQLSSKTGDVALTT